MRTRIMYIEDKSAGLVGLCRIGRVRFSKTGSTLFYGDRAFQSLKGAGFKANYFDVDNGDEFWISGPRRDGADGLYGRLTQPDDVDDDVAETYWRDIRGQSATHSAKANSVGELTTETHAEMAPRDPANFRHGRSRARIARTLRRRASQSD